MLEKNRHLSNLVVELFPLVCKFSSSKYCHCIRVKSKQLHDNLISFRKKKIWKILSNQVAMHCFGIFIENLDSILLHKKLLSQNIDK